MEIESYRDGMNDSMVIDEDSNSEMSYQQPQQTKKRSKKKRESPMDSMMVSWKLGRQPIPPDIAAYTENIRRQNLLENDDDEVDMLVRNNNSNNSSNESLYLINNIHNTYHDSMTKLPNHEVTISHNKPMIPKLDFNSTKFFSNHLNNNSSNEQSSNMLNSTTINQSNVHTGNNEKLPSVHELLPGWVPSTNTSPNQSPRTFSVTSPVSSTTTSPRGNIQTQSPLTSPRLNSSYSQQSNLNYTTYSPRLSPAPSPILSTGNLPLSSPHGYSSFGLASPHQIPQSPNTTSQTQTQLLYTSSPNDSPRILTPTMKKGTLQYHSGLSPLSSPRISSPHYSESLLSINHSHTTSTNSVSLEELMKMKLGQN